MCSAFGPWMFSAKMFDAVFELKLCLVPHSAASCRISKILTARLHLSTKQPPNYPNASVAPVMNFSVRKGPSSRFYVCYILCTTDQIQFPSDKFYR